MYNHRKYFFFKYLDKRLVKKERSNNLSVIFSLYHYNCFIFNYLHMYLKLENNIHCSRFFHVREIKQCCFTCSYNKMISIYPNRNFRKKKSYSSHRPLLPDPRPRNSIYTIAVIWTICANVEYILNH